MNTHKSKKKMSIAKLILMIAMAIFSLSSIVGVIVLVTISGTFAEGNAAKYSVAKTSVLDYSPLKGKTILFLGSSVTVGTTIKGESFVDFLAKRDGIIPIKKAVSGTTLVDSSKNSYIARMENVDPKLKIDAFICQLSTNDATKNLDLGSISDSRALSDFDTQTIAGAIEYIIVYARTTWNAPVIFYTGTKYNSEQYEEMVDLLLEIQQKWDIGVIDLWNNDAMHTVSQSDYELYMLNEIHPTRAGYRDWWTPVMENYLIEYFENNNAA